MKNKSSILVAEEWLQKNKLTLVVQQNQQSKFLAQKAKTSTLFASAKSKDEYLLIFQGIVQDQDSN